MKKTQLLDARRNIRKEIVAFTSIVIIGLLAALAYLGIAYTAAALKIDAVKFFNDQKLWDLEVASTMLMTEEDLDAIRAVPGVDIAEHVWQIDTKLHVGDSNTSITVTSLPEEMSQPVLLEGRLPESTKECAIEKNLADDCGLTIGQSIVLECDKIMEIDPLAEKEFFITGIFYTPDHFSYMVPVTPYVFVLEDSFNREGLDGAFMKARIHINGTPENRYSEEYWNIITPVSDELETLAEDRAPARVEDLRNGFEETIRDGEAKIETAKEELLQAKQKIEDGRRDLEKAETQLGDMKKLIDYSEPLLNEGKVKVETARENLNKVQQILNDPDHISASDKDWILDNISVFNSRLKELDISEEQFREMLNSADSSELKEILPELVNYDKLSEKYREAEELYEFARNSWYYTGEQYLDGLTLYQNGKKQLEEGEREVAEGEEKIRDAERDLAEAKEKLNDIGTCRWVVLNNNGNPGFVYAAANSDKLASLSMSFSTIFLIVGALVIYATISRMVEQQRKLIGVNKAMGLYNREIFAKYLLFACSAVLLGVGMGVVLAWLPMQRAVLSSYEAHLNYGTGDRCFLPFETGLVIAGAVAISVVAVYLGCSQLLRQSALSLMQGAKSSHGGRKRRLVSAKRNLYYRLILRNMMTDWNRVTVTIASIAGGCVLMVVGFTLRYGISGVPDRQFGGIQTYDAEVFYETAGNADAAAEIEQILDRNALQHINLHKENSVYEMDETLNALTMIVAEKGVMESYFKLTDVHSCETTDLPDSGALIPRRFQEYYHVEPGDTVTVYDSGMNHRQLEVAGVFENYYGQLFFLTPQSYENTFGTAPKNNCFFVKTAGMSLNELQKKLEGIEGFVSANDAAADRTMIEQFTSSLNFVVYLMLFIAGMMACFIVANFTMTFIQRKTGELTIMRINGFTSGECIRYVAVDLIVTTILGTVLGLVVGNFMGARILGVTETPYIQMIRVPRLETFLYSALITFCFSLLTNGFALRRIRRLKLTDIS